VTEEDLAAQSNKRCPPVPAATYERSLRGPLALDLPFGRVPDDPAVEWRCFFAEFFGTAMLVLLTAVVDAVVPGSVPLTARAVATGLVVYALIYSTGAVGGAHLNPAVTLSFAVRGNFPWISGRLRDHAAAWRNRRRSAPSGPPSPAASEAAQGVLRSSGD
jgi:hypothetical protein